MKHCCLCILFYFVAVVVPSWARWQFLSHYFYRRETNASAMLLISRLERRDTISACYFKLRILDNVSDGGIRMVSRCCSDVTELVSCRCRCLLILLFLDNQVQLLLLQFYAQSKFSKVLNQVVFCLVSFSIS